MNWYRCRAEIGDGGYTSYIGPDISAALDSMALHLTAHTVVVEQMGYTGDWDSVVAGIYRRKGNTHEGSGVPGHVADSRVGVGVVHPQQDTERAR